MSSGAIGWVDHCRGDINGAPTLDANGGYDVLAFDPAYPARNCITPDVSRVTRVDFDRKSSGSQDADLDFDIGTQFVRVVAALNMRLPADVSSVQCHVLNSTPAILESGTIYQTGDLSLIPGTTDRYDLFWILSTTQQCSGVKLTVSLPASSVGYFEVGRVWAGPAIVFPGGVGVDQSLTGVDPSRIFRSEGGGYAAFPYPTRKIIAVTQRGLVYEQAMGGFEIDSLRDVFLGAGMSSPVVLISNNATQHEAQVGSVYGLMTSIPSLDHAGKQRYGTQLRVEQLR